MCLFISLKEEGIWVISLGTGPLMEIDVGWIL